MKNNKNNNCNFPTLRFPEFEGEWKKDNIGDVISIKSDKHNPESCRTEFICVELESLSQGTGELLDTFNSAAQKSIKNKFSSDSVLFGKLRPYLKKFYLSDFEGVCSSEIWVMTSRKLEPVFLYSFIQTPYFIGLANQSSGSKMPRADWGLIANSKIAYPPNNLERVKIGRFLKLINERIASQTKIIAHLESQIKGLYSTTNKIGWKSYLLSELMTERKELNTKQFSIYSVSVDVGLVDQIEHLGRSFAAKDTRHYNVVRPGDVVYTKSPTGSFPFGIVKQSLVNTAVAVSPLYGVYQPKSIHIGRIIQHYFASPIRTNNYLHSLIQKGAKNTINISTQHFLDKAILLPSSEKEIISISELLASYNNKCEIEREVRKRLLLQKSHLLQKLFI